MDTQVEESVKKRFPFFESGLREAIMESGIYREYAAGEELIREDQYIRSFPIVITGLIKVCRTDEAGNELLLYYLRPGEVCTVSLICCMDRTRSRVKALTEEDTSVILIPVELLDVCVSNNRNTRHRQCHDQEHKCFTYRSPFFVER